MKELRPIRETPKDYEAIEEAIVAALRRELYFPLLRVLKKPKATLQNAREDLFLAISSGRIRYAKGQFTGRFNSTLSKDLRSFGAEWDRKQGSWKVPRLNLPVDIQEAIDLAEEKFLQTARDLDKKLSQILPAEIADRVKLESAFDTTLWRMDERFRENVKAIAVPPNLTPERAKRISEEYTEDMKRYIQEWTEKEIKELREKIQQSAFTGARYEGVVSPIEDMLKTVDASYGVCKRKAKFLARQETNLLLTKYKEVRYEEVGVRYYRWQCVVGSPNHPVRPMHKDLNGKIFTWDNPPVTSEDGSRNNPGQDFNCRCVAIPLVNYKPHG